MKWNEKKSNGVNLSNVSAKGLPTLGTGEYKGFISGISEDSGKNTWITLSSQKGSHMEQTSLDLSEFEVGDEVMFTIEAQDGAVALMKGNKYQLVNGTEKLTDWVPLQELYRFIKDNEIQLAVPKIKEIRY